jgi:ribonuclease HII
VGVSYRIGADENGLGARLGPLVVTAVLARVDEAGTAALARRLPKKIAEDLDDSKRLVSHGDVALGEAWTRALVAPDAASPNELFNKLSLEGEASLREPCPRHIEHQCWSPDGESFVAEPELVARVSGHNAKLRARGIDVLRVKSSVVCTRRLNDARERGGNRFISDLHAMEHLVLSFRREVGADVHAVCGKVGGMGDYSRFFGPLGGWLHAELEKSRAKSAYRFPGVGELHFVRDADAHDPLVMLASLVGKYVRELLMARVARFYRSSGDDESFPSGYNDPHTNRFVAETALVRKKRRVPKACFERAGVADDG